MVEAEIVLDHLEPRYGRDDQAKWGDETHYYLTSCMDYCRVVNYLHMYYDANRLHHYSESHTSFSARPSSRTAYSEYRQ